MARVSQETFIPGDSILFQAGQTHTVTGTGANNALRGSGTFASATFASTYSSTYTSTLSTCSGGASWTNIQTKTLAAGATAPQAAHYADVYCGQHAVDSALDAAFAAADVASSWITIGRYGTGADPKLDGGGTAETGIYISRASTGGWKVSHLVFDNFTRAGVDFENQTTIVGSSFFTGGANGLWLEYLDFQDVSVGTPAHPQAPPTGFMSFYGAAMALRSLNYVRVNHTTTGAGVDGPMYLLHGNSWLVDDNTWADSKWEHPQMFYANRTRFARNTLSGMCQLGYPDGSAGLFVATMTDWSVRDSSITDTKRPISAISGTLTPDGSAIDYESGMQAGLVENNILNDNAGTPVAWVQNPTVTTPPGKESLDNLLVGNTIRRNGFSAFSTALGRAKHPDNPVVWVDNTIERPGSPPAPAPGISLFQIVGTGAYVGNTVPSGWVFGSDNVILPDPP